jgi:hypothetical protein
MKGIDLKNYEHDRSLSEIRVSLENLGKVVDWVSERNIRSRSLFLRIDEKTKIIPDAYCRSLKDGSELIVEFENSRKSNTRIRALLKTYQMYFSLSQNTNQKVLFFFISESLLKSFKSFYQSQKLNFPVSFILSSDVGVSVVDENRRWRV